MHFEVLSFQPPTAVCMETYFAAKSTAKSTVSVSPNDEVQRRVMLPPHAPSQPSPPDVERHAPEPLRTYVRLTSPSVMIERLDGPASRAAQP